MAEKKVKVKFSIRWKLFLSFVVFALLLSNITLTISYFVYRKTSEEGYGATALNLAKTQASSVDTTALKEVKELVLTKFDEVIEQNNNELPDLDDETQKTTFLAKFDSVSSNDSFIKIQSYLDSIFEDNTVASTYFGVISSKYDALIVLADSKHSNNYWAPGYFDYPLSKEQKDQIKDLPAKDQIIKPYLDESLNYGAILCTSVPILDSDESLICHSYVDIGFAKVVSGIQNFLASLAVFVGIFALAFTVLAVFLFNLTIVKPIKKLDEATASYLEEGNENSTQESQISKLKINTKDEVEHLTHSIQTLEKSIAGYIASIKNISAQQERYSTELDIAEKIQRGLLPNNFPNNDNYQITAYIDPAKEVGGDFYDFFMVDETHLALVIADVSGKGIPAALFMAIGKTLLMDHTINSKNLSQTFTLVNNLLSRGNSSDMFITAYEGLLDLETGEYKFVNAGHEMPFIYKEKNNTFESYKCKPGFVLAGMPDIKYQEGQLKLDPGDKIFLYTDGIPEASNDAKNRFGMEKLQRVLRENRHEDTETIIDSVKREVDRFVSGAPQFDDITMLCFEFKQKIEGRTKKLEVGANLSNFVKVLDFVNNHLELNYIEKKTINKIDIALDELFSNVCNYAYDDGLGKVTVTVSVTSTQIKISLIDDGKPYNPLEHDDPDITQSVKERQIGGLGIMMVKKTMDDVKYEYKHKQNIITIIKNI